MLRYFNKFFLFIFSFLSLPVVTAQMFSTFRYEAISLIDSITQTLAPIFEAIIGDYSGSELFFAKVLFLILLFIVINLALTNFPPFKDGKQKGLVALVALIVSILAVRYVADDAVIYGVLLPYGTLALALWIIIPFFIFFYFLHSSNFGHLGRRLGWVSFGVIYLVMWTYRYEDFSPMVNWIYFFSLVGLIIVFLMDRNIHGYFGTAKHEALVRRHKMRQLADLEADIEKLEGIANKSDYTKATLADLKRKHAELRRGL